MWRLIFYTWIVTAGVFAPAADSKGWHRHRPRNVTISVVNPTTMKITWLAPRVNSAKCPVTRYLIRLKDDAQQRSKAWNVDGARQSLSLHDLTDDTWYFVRLVALTCKGKSRPTKWFKVKTPAREEVEKRAPPANVVENRSPNKPEYVRTRTFSDSVILSWRPPGDATLVRGYMVGYGEGVPDVNWRYVSAANRNVTISNLKSGTQYVISLRAFNNYGKGPVVYDLIYTRDKTGQPVGNITSPTDLRAKVLSPTTAWLQWSDPSLGRPQQVTDSRYYNVHYQRQPGSRTLSVIVKALHVVLYDLVPGTSYIFSVRTIKDANASPFSDKVTNRTFEKAPSSPPRTVELSATNTSRSLYVTWRPPRQPNGLITGYLVLYTSDPGTEPDDWQVKAVTPTEEETMLSLLRPSTTYHVRVQARNSQGYGPLSPSVELATVADRSPPHELRHHVNTTAKVGGAGRTLRHRQPIVAAPPVSHVVSQDYPTMRTAAHTSPTDVTRGGAARASTSASANQRPAADDVTPQLRFNSLVSYSVSAVITWTQADCGDDVKPADSYRLRYNPVGHTTLMTEETLFTNFALLKGLAANTRYHYRVKYVYAGGASGGWSQPAVFDTTIHRAGTQ